MARKRSERPIDGQEVGGSLGGMKKVFINFLNAKQQAAFNVYQNSQITFLTGPAGSGKSFLAMAFAIQEVLSKQKEKIVITRPIVEAGERLGFLPGDLNEKVAPYMMPLFDCINKICGPAGSSVRSMIEKKVEVAPLAYLRGRTLENCVAILDESQNCSPGQIKLFLTRLGQNAKMIVTGDPEQSDLFAEPDLVRVAHNLRGVDEIGHIHFSDADIVRNPLIAEILKRI